MAMLSDMTKNKKIFYGVLVVVIIVLITAGILAWQYWWLPRDEVGLSEDAFVKSKGDLEKYVPQVIVEGKWGKEPREFGMRMWEGSPDFPTSLVVDRKGDIFILDTFNNRIQKFTKEGRYITSVPVETYRGSTKEEIEESKKSWNRLGFDFPTIYAKEMYIDQEDNLYLEKERKEITTGESHKKFLKYLITGQVIEIGQSEFERMKEQTNPKQISIEFKDNKYLIELAKLKQGYAQDIVIHNLNTNQDQIISFKLTYPATEIGFIKVDRGNKIYVFTAWPPQIHKYNLQGTSVALVDLYGLPNPYGKHPILATTPYIDANGDIYQMELIPNPDKRIEHFPGLSVGLKIIRWTVQ